MAEAPAEADANEWEQIIENLWNEYDKDNSGYLDKEEMMPLAKAALAQIGYNQEVDPAVCDAFFAEVDSDGNGQVDKDELMKFMKSLM